MNITIRTGFTIYSYICALLYPYGLPPVLETKPFDDDDDDDDDST